LHIFATGRDFEQASMKDDKTRKLEERIKALETQVSRLEHDVQRWAHCRVGGGFCRVLQQGKEAAQEEIRTLSQIEHVFLINFLM
jgi:uncharacterized protein (DUF3084 family)